MDSARDKIIKRIIKMKGVESKVLEELDKKSNTFKEFKNNLLNSKIVSEEEFMIILSEEYNISYLDIDRYLIPKENKKLLAKDKAMHYKIIPLANIGGVLTLATSDPLDLVALDDIKAMGKFTKIDLVLAREGKIIKALENLYLDATTDAYTDSYAKEVTLNKETQLEREEDLDQLVKESTLPPIIRVVDLIIYEGLKRHASDIHIEPTDTELAIRYRIDGILHQELTIPKENKNAIVTRFKLMSSLNITEFRVPQDGRFKIKFEGREIDFRVSSLPTNLGEKLVLRILDRESLSKGIGNLGFSEIPKKLFSQALEAPFGIILVTGPTGSGKSTTLYSVITQMNEISRNIITIEDPVEYRIDGITQIQVKPEIGLTFASCLRSVLRQSPDLVMVGEIRDLETADIAIKASLTGEFIFSTLHTNDSVGAITRLIDMGIEPFLLASSLIATTAQRLVRKLCPNCKDKYLIEAKLAKRIGLSQDAVELFRSKGCSYCNNTGYKGREALVEVLLIDDKIRDMIVNRAKEEEIIDYATKEKDFTPFKEDGFKKCLAGITSIEEVLRVAG